MKTPCKPKVQIIETIAPQVQDGNGIARPVKKRVAAYARVSTEQDEQQSSYEAQVDFYTRYIQSNPEWVFAGIYSDAGITGTNTKHRDGFNRMIQDALAGRLDLILTKSISRFARNTVDTLTTVRKLKEKGVEVYFEKENIYTLDAKGEVMITIMSSLAQEESRSISENVTWGIQKSMQDGKISLPYNSFLGYEKGPDGNPKIVEKEAKIIRRIYALFLEGKSVRFIADRLTKDHIPTPRGKAIWSVSTIQSILRNEKYKGDALLQKTYTADFLTKEKIVNRGERRQYYVAESHDAIIEPEVFDLVQQELERRKYKRGQSASPFSARVYCGTCGAYYGAKVWHSKDQYRTRIWRCNEKYRHASPCKTPHVTEEQLKEGFCLAMNKILQNRSSFLHNFTEELLPLANTIQKKQKEREEAEDTLETIQTEVEKLIAGHTIRPQNQPNYLEELQRLEAEQQRVSARIACLHKQILSDTERQEKIRAFLCGIQDTGVYITHFEESLWTVMISRVVVSEDRILTYTFKDGIEIPVMIP